MARGVRWLGYIGLALAVLMGQTGCAPYAVRALPPPSLSEAERATLGTIGIGSGDLSPRVGLKSPTSGKGDAAWKAGSAGAFVSIGAGILSSNAVFLALGVGLAPVVGLGGAVYGAMAAESATTVAEAEAALQGVLGEGRFQEALRDRVFLVAQEGTRRPLVRLEQPSPTAREEAASDSSRAAGHVDTVLEVRLEDVGFAGCCINPPLALIVKVETRLLRVEDGKTLYESTLEYRSRTRKFVSWAANDAQMFRDELNRAAQSLAEKIVEDVFLLYVIPPREERPS